MTPSRKVDDDLLLNSVKLTGIQQPIIVVQISERDYLVIDGVRRLNVAKSLGLDAVPCVIDTGIDDVDDEVHYRNRIRFILDEHRQDLLPSQRAALIRKLQQMFGMQAKQVALYLGVTSGTITNWTLIDKMIPEIRRAIDNDELTVHTARAFAGITDDGQRELWEKHSDEILGMTGSRLHQFAMIFRNLQSG